MESSAPPTGAPANDGPVSWSTGLFDCFDDIPNCCLSCWCPCIIFGQISEIVDRGSSSCATNGAIYVLLGLVTASPCLYSCCYRPKLRRQYQIEEDPYGDCVVHFFCDSCALGQEYRELQHRGFDMTMGVGWQGNVEQQTPGVTNIQPPIFGGMVR